MRYFRTNFRFVILDSSTENDKNNISGSHALIHWMSQTNLFSEISIRFSIKYIWIHVRAPQDFFHITLPVILEYLSYLIDYSTICCRNS